MRRVGSESRRAASPQGADRDVNHRLEYGSAAALPLVADAPKLTGPPPCTARTLRNGTCEMATGTPAKETPRAHRVRIEPYPRGGTTAMSTEGRSSAQTARTS